MKKYLLIAFIKNNHNINKLLKFINFEKYDEYTSDLNILLNNICSNIYIKIEDIYKKVYESTFRNF